MPALLARALPATARALLLLAAAAGTAAAQVGVSYYTGAPNPATFSTTTGADFGGLTLACTANVAAVDFPSAASLAGICGGPAVNGFGESARFLGALHAPTAGSYVFRIFNDDGFALFLNGSLAVNRFHDDYQPNGVLYTLQLQAGLNPFQLDYYANEASFSFIDVELPTGVTYASAAASTVPEPATVALLGGGLAVLGAVARRRRAAA
ncbi:PEP-CTERM sorting domain-containing protein [Roseisolibacter agri]|nr:PEP-CTERM sorting domain-containing protein [Roseisolibacter agri]